MAAQQMRIPREGGDIGGLLAQPEVEGTYPGIVMIPTVRGLDPFAEYVVERLAGDGFLALAVDIFDHPGVPEDPFKRSGSQPDERVLGDLDAAFSMLKGHRSVQGDAISAWGYCIGGRFALLWPTYQPSLAAGAAFHGFPVNDTSNPNTPTEAAGRVDKLTVPVIGCFGEADRLVPMSAVDRYRSELERHGKDFEIHTYPDADHGWTNPKGEPYRQEAAEDCWDKARKFITRRIAARQAAAV
jgi:carboxymethylenebutenolidase